MKCASFSASDVPAGHSSGATVGKRIKSGQLTSFYSFVCWKCGAPNNARQKTNTDRSRRNKLETLQPVAGASLRGNSKARGSQSEGQPENWPLSAANLHIYPSGAGRAANQGLCQLAPVPPADLCDLLTRQQLDNSTTRERAATLVICKPGWASEFARVFQSMPAKGCHCCRR